MGNAETDIKVKKSFERADFDYEKRGGVKKTFITAGAIVAVFFAAIAAAGKDEDESLNSENNVQTVRQIETSNDSGTAVQEEETLPEAAPQEPTLEPENSMEPVSKEMEYILPDSNSRYLTGEELNGLSSEELRLAKNELYARHGRKFNDKSLQEYFNSCSWYTGTVEPEEFRDDDFFNEYEKANRDLIIEAQNSAEQTEGSAEAAKEIDLENIDDTEILKRFNIELQTWADRIKTLGLESYAQYLKNVQSMLPSMGTKERVPLRLQDELLSAPYYEKAKALLIGEELLYEGEMKNNRPDGFGILYGADYNSLSAYIMYIGEFKDGRYHGIGFELDNASDNIYSSYMGEFKDGKYNGDGMNIQYNYDIYEVWAGNFENGEPSERTAYYIGDTLYEG